MKTKIFATMICGCNDCPNIRDPRPPFKLMYCMTARKELKGIRIMNQIPEWCPLPDYNDNIVNRFWKELEDNTELKRMKDEAIRTAEMFIS